MVYIYIHMNIKYSIDNRTAIMNTFERREFTIRDKRNVNKLLKKTFLTFINQ